MWTSAVEVLGNIIKYFSHTKILVLVPSLVIDTSFGKFIWDNTAYISEVDVIAGFMSI